MYIEKIPKSLLDDITSNRCIPFIGAGFSKNAKSAHNINIPDWNGLGKKAAEYLAADEYENAIESLSQYENQYSRANLTEMIAQEIHINETFPGDTHLSFCRLYFDIICTTNFDFLLENAFGEIYSKQGKPYHVITNENRLSTFLNEKTTILKLHGDFSDPKNMVITETDYDLYITKNPLFCTYIANLLITRTPLLIGYSLNDPDLRMLWAIIGSRLNSLRRIGYAILCSASENDIARYKRRGINVINLPVKKDYYGAALTQLFGELLEYWNKTTEENIKTSNEEAMSVLKFSDDEMSGLCFFSVPYNKLSLYKKYVFPVVERRGLVPVAADEFILPGENISAKINTLIQKAKISIVDISSGNSDVFMELGIIAEKNKPCLVVSDAKTTIPTDGTKYSIVIGNFENEMENLLNSIEHFIGKYAVTHGDFIYEPKRLFELKEYNAAIISAIRLLEIKLTKQWFSKELSDTSSNAVIPLTQLIKISGNNYDFEIKQLKEWSSIRNQVVHSEFKASRNQCKNIVDGVYKIIEKMN